MKRPARVLLSLILVLTLTQPGFAQDAVTAASTSASPASGAPALVSASAATAAGAEPETIYQALVVAPAYRFVTTSGYAGRAAEYDSLRNSAGGSLSLTRIDEKNQSSWKYEGQFLSGDDYDMKAEMRLKQYLILKLDGGSFVRNIDRAGFGRNVDDPNVFYPNIGGNGDLTLTDEIARGNALAVSRRRLNLDARLIVPESPIPVTFFVRGGWQGRQGTTQVQFMDMGASSRGVGCAGCHASSKYQPVNNAITDIHAGMEVKLHRVLLTYEHHYRSFANWAGNPKDFYGFAADDGAHPPSPFVPGVDYFPTPTTLDGFYNHNILPNNQMNADSVRLRVPITNALTFNGGAGAGHTRNLYTDNTQRTLNGDATVNWRPLARLRVTADVHYDDLRNEFTPAAYPLFADLSFQRWKAGARADYRLSKAVSADVYYRRRAITRSDAQFWPQFYSFDSRILQGTPADAFVPRRVKSTSSDIAGSTLKWRYGEGGDVHAGYEWTGTHAPGYLTDPDQSHRFSLGAAYAPRDWLTLSNNASVTLDTRSDPLRRTDRLYLDTSYLAITPSPNLTLTFGYAFSEEDVRTNLSYTADPVFPNYFFQEAGVPFSATSHVFSLSWKYRLSQNVTWTADLRDTLSRSSFRSNLRDFSFAGNPGGTSVGDATSFSEVNVIQPTASTGVAYGWHGFTAGITFQYGSYRDWIHHEFNGHYQTVSVAVARAW